MSKLTAYTIELYKKDRRIKRDERYGKNKVGLRFVRTLEVEMPSRVAADVLAKTYEQEGFVATVYETYVTRTNMMSGKEYKERYDTPYFCSPSSETYWSM